MTVALPKERQTDRFTPAECGWGMQVLKEQNRTQT